MKVWIFGPKTGFFQKLHFCVLTSAFEIFNHLSQKLLCVILKLIATRSWSFWIDGLNLTHSKLMFYSCRGSFACFAWILAGIAGISAGFWKTSQTCKTCTNGIPGLDCMNSTRLCFISVLIFSVKCWLSEYLLERSVNSEEVIKLFTYRMMLPRAIPKLVQSLKNPIWFFKSSIIAAQKSVLFRKFENFKWSKVSAYLIKTTQNSKGSVTIQVGTTFCGKLDPPPPTTFSEKNCGKWRVIRVFAQFFTADFTAA